MDRVFNLFNRDWTAKDSREFRDSGLDSLFVMVDKKTARISLRFLAELPQLVKLQIAGPIVDDLVVQSLHNLEFLSLNTSSNKPIDFSQMRKLNTLAVRDRSGLESVAGLESLQSLSVWQFKRSDLGWMRPLTGLRSLRIESKSRSLSLDGLEASRNLQELMVMDTNIASLEPLRSMQDLVDMHVVGNGKAVDPPWDLDAIAHPKLQWLRYPNAGPVESLAPVSRMPALQAICIGLGVADGQLEPLLQLASDVNVVEFTDRPNYSHKNKDIKRARSRTAPT